STSTPTCTSRVTPTAAAAPIAATGSPPTMSRWVCESRTGTASGCGGGGFIDGSSAEPGQFLVDDRRVELLEDRLRRVERATDLDRPRLPPRADGLVAGQHRVPRPALQVVDLDDRRHGCVHPGTAEQFVDRLRGVRQERRQQRVAV